jgi:hypothetical protein
MRWRCGQQAKIFEDMVESVVFLRWRAWPRVLQHFSGAEYHCGKVTVMKGEDFLSVFKMKSSG